MMQEAKDVLVSFMVTNDARTAGIVEGATFMDNAGNVAATG